MSETPGEIDCRTFPAGWYPDGVGGQRWWDGQQWTEHYQAGEAVTGEGQSSLNQVPRRKLSPAVAITMIAAIVVVVLGGASALTVALLNGAQGDGKGVASAPTTIPDPRPIPEPNEQDVDKGDSNKFDGVFEERDEFMKEQQQPVGDDLLSAKTPEQKALVAEARAHVEQNGREWGVEGESLVLVLALNACETSILNGHDINESTVQMHAATSPIIAATLQGATEEQRVTATTGLMNLTVTGTSYLCPADTAQWSSAVDATGGKW
ncbi:DUF2510 domain-containing protein [Leucobacter coleopterorum]|uniref:DUF2510 domain-containing protein n=1 Tax=Leucobacter coleopterorum TaxID=2714933 RepID=UPI001FCB5B41|nr:DUF2510 domain-containing protein [Leucobacter coleopterorum]